MSTEDKVWILLAMLVSFVILLSVVLFGPDNAVEEYAERMFEDSTGISIDVTPSTPE